MKVNVLAENLNRAMSITSRVVASRAQLPILSNVLLRATKEGLQVLATDLEIGVRLWVGAKVEEEGEICISARVLAEFVGTLSSGVIEMAIEKENLVLKVEGSTARLPGVDGGEFPAIPSSKSKVDLELPIERLVEIVNTVSFAAARDDSRPIFTGILWKLEAGKLTLAATDGYRLSVDELKVETDKTEAFVLPVRALQEVVKGVEKGEKKVGLYVDLEKQQVIFKAGGTEWVSRLLSGEFPPYNQILPSGFVTKMTVGRLELGEAVKRALIFAKESANIVKLSIGEGKLVVSANGAAGGGETTMEVEMEGESETVAFNGRYVVDYLNVAESEDVVFESAGPLKAGLFKMPGKKLLHVIMPVRVQG